MNIAPQIRPTKFCSYMPTAKEATDKLANHDLVIFAYGKRVLNLSFMMISFYT
nr:MAG TPA: FMN-Dependent azoreductase [Caudoviricetes sp.]